MGIASNWYFCLCPQWIWHSSVSQRGFVREGMMFRAPTWCADLAEAGGTFS